MLEPWLPIFVVSLWNNWINLVTQWHLVKYRSKLCFTILLLHIKTWGCFAFGHRMLAPNPHVSIGCMASCVSSYHEILLQYGLGADLMCFATVWGFVALWTPFPRTENDFFILYEWWFIRREHQHHTTMAGQFFTLIARADRPTILKSDWYKL